MSEAGRVGEIILGQIAKVTVLTKQTRTKNANMCLMVLQVLEKEKTNEVQRLTEELEHSETDVQQQKYVLMSTDLRSPQGGCCPKHARSRPLFQHVTKLSNINWSRIFGGRT